MTLNIPTQRKMNHTIESIPVEYFKWGTYPDHFKIEMPHRHQFGELLFFTQGGGLHEIDYCNHRIQSNSVHYIPRSATHFLRRDLASSGFTLAFDAAFFETNNTHKFVNPLVHEPFALNFSSEKFENISEQTNQILYQIKQHKSYYREKCFLLSMELLLTNLAASQQKETHENREKNELVRRFKNLVHSNYHCNRVVSWYATQLNVSPKYLGNQVKQELGRSPKDFILSVVLKSIKRQLLDSNKSLKNIAFEHHYDLSALGKLFKKNVGFSMKAYRSYAH